MTEKRSWKKNPVIWILAFVAIFLVGFSATSAQEFLSDQSLEVSPPSQELKVNPGESISVQAKVRNKSRKALPIKVRVEDFTASGDEGQVALVKQDPKYSLVNWTSIATSNFTLEPGETKSIEAKISVPKDAAGGRYGSIVFGVTGDVARGEKAAAVSQEIASLFLVRVNGPASESLALEQFTAPSFSEFGPVPFNMKFINSGNVHVRTYGLVNVSDMFGKKVDDVVVTPTNVFPGSNRVVHSQLSNKWLFGRYTALAIMNYGSKNESLTASTTFIVAPVKFILIGLFALFILFKSRKRIKKALRALSSK